MIHHQSNETGSLVFLKRGGTRDSDFSRYLVYRDYWLLHHIDSNTTQKLANRAYKVVEKVLFWQAKS